MSLPPTHSAANLFPLLQGDEFKALVDDIRLHGLIEPVWMYDDPEHGLVLLDGRNRWRACDESGVEIRKRTYAGDDPIGFAVSTNLARRHLTHGQRDAVAFDLEPLYAAEAARRVGGRPRKDVKPRADLPTVLPRARDHAAKAAGASGRGVAQFKRIAQQAPDLEAKVRAGTIAIDRAERIIRDREAEARRIAEARAEADAQPAPSTVDIRHGDFREVLADLADIDAIITDPPYPQQYLHLIGDLAAWADKVLAPDGVLAVLIGQTHLPEVYRLLDGHRAYRWTCAYLTPGRGYVSHPRKIQSNWKPLLIYGGGPRISDVLTTEGTDANAKTMHKWGQDYGAFHTLIERLTARGQTIADPFMGSGTTLLAGHALGRHVIGADDDLAAVTTARERLR